MPPSSMKPRCSRSSMSPLLVVDSRISSAYNHSRGRLSVVLRGHYRLRRSRAELYLSSTSFRRRDDRDTTAASVYSAESGLRAYPAGLSSSFSGQS